MDRMRNRRAFTIVELIIVMAIIAAIVFDPAKRIANARNARRLHTVDQLQKALQEFVADNGQFPGDKTIPQDEANAIQMCRFASSGWRTGFCGSDGFKRMLYYTYVFSLSDYPPA